MAALDVKISMDLLKELRSYGDFKLKESGSPKFSTPPSLWSYTSDPPRFWRWKHVLEVLYHRIKFGGARVLPPPARPNTLTFLFVCTSRLWRHAFERRACEKMEFVRTISPWGRWSTKTILIWFDRGRFCSCAPTFNFLHKLPIVVTTKRQNLKKRQNLQFSAAQVHATQ